jgi:PAS domain S-box-containing protein
MGYPTPHPWRILLVELNEEHFLLTRELLKQARGRLVHLDWAPTYSQADVLLHEQPYDAVLVEYDLGQLTGIDLIRRLRAQGLRLPLILYSGRSSYEVEVEAMEAGASLYITKEDINPLLLERSIRYAIERKRLEQEQAALIESIQDGFFALNQEWEFLFVNQTAASSMGMQPADLLGRNIWELFPALLGTSLEQNYRAVMQERQACHFEMQGVYRGVWYSINVYPFWKGISVFWVDISARKQLETDLHRSEERFSKAFNATPDALVLSRLSDGRIEMVNDSFERLFGYSRAETIGKTSSDLHMIVDPTARQALVEQVRRQGSIRRAAIDIRRRSGEIRQASLSIELLDIQDEHFILTIIEDITEQNQAARKLEDAHQRMTEILESISDAFYSLDHEMRFTYVNQKAMTEWNKTREELLGQLIWDVFPIGKQSESYEKMEQARLDRQPTHYESYSAFLNRWVEVRIYPSQQGISVYFHDITDRKQKEQTLAEYARELELNNRELEEFAFVASHDLQEPLRKIEALGDFIAAGAENLTPEQIEYFSRLQKSVRRMRTMVEGLHQLARLSANPHPLVEVDLNQVAQEVLFDLELPIKQSSAVVEIGELPVLQADPLQMHQLLQNLFANALKFQPRDRAPRVRVFAQELNPQVVQIFVQDNGIGFEQELAPRLFYPFKRLVGRSEYEGSGMGLAIARKIVERHGGSISVHSQVGQGTTFTITLPVRPSSA